MKQECGNCRFMGKSEGLLFCFRYPPVIAEFKTLQKNDYFMRCHLPGVLPDHWCGEWEAKRKKK